MVLTCLMNAERTVIIRQEIFTPRRFIGTPGLCHVNNWGTTNGDLWQYDSIKKDANRSTLLQQLIPECQAFWGATGAVLHYLPYALGTPLRWY